MNENDVELIEQYLSGTISPESLEALNELLEIDESARERFLSLATIDEGLSELAAVPPVVEGVSQSSKGKTILEFPVKSRVSPFWPAWRAAAAGLLAGIFCTTAIWAATETGRRKIVTLLQDSFESEADLLSAGGPVNSDVWAGDYAEITSETSGVTPLDGKQMFRFLRADFEGKEKPIGYSGDIYRLVDLQSYEHLLEDGGASVEVHAAFGSIPVEVSNRFECHLTVSAFSEVPKDIENWRAILIEPSSDEPTALASSMRRMSFPRSSSYRWMRNSLSMQIPPEARFLLIAIRLVDTSASESYRRGSLAVQFEGQFLDDVRVKLHYNN